ncbi:MAG: DUF72 domain-containing protein [Thermoprotei archaeon]|nr:MAG: DUF72 domain-containing protein [Thermoprotei archaeon]
MSIIKVGTCGWSIKGGRKRYFETFKIIELQQTFYKLPRKETALKWRQEAPQGFEFELKAWQVITHPHTSPSWRKAGIRVSEEKKDKYGFLRPTEENFKAWEQTLEIAEILKAKIIVVQTPPSFGYTPVNYHNVENFFSSIRRNGFLIGWEPRGTWNNNLSKVKMLVDKLDLIHIVDILRRNSVSKHNVAYFRLHGLGGREVNYRYKYTDDDLQRLCEKVKEYQQTKDEIYVLFNNIYMGSDALRFKNMCLKYGFEVV